MFGIIPFLVHWLAFSRWISTSSKPQVPQSNWQSQNSHSVSTASYWSLLSDFQSLPEEEVELFLPQICNILLDREHLQSSPQSQQIYHYLENIVLQKCAKSLPFGIKCCSILRAYTPNEREGLFRNMFLNSQSQQKKQQEEETYHRLLSQMEYMTAHGEQHLPLKVKQLRYEYYKDFRYILDLLQQIGTQLKSYPVNQRAHHLQEALHQCNQLCYYRMYTQSPIHSVSTTIPSQYFQHIQDALSVNTIASLCPGIAYFALHFPLQSSHQPALRLLRFIESECEILPSKDHCPFRVIVECLEQPFLCKSDELFTEGTRLSLTQAEEACYSNPQVMPTMHITNEKVLPAGFDYEETVPFYEQQGSIPDIADRLSREENKNDENNVDVANNLLSQPIFQVELKQSEERKQSWKGMNGKLQDYLEITEEGEDGNHNNNDNIPLWSTATLQSKDTQTEALIAEMFQRLKRINDATTTTNEPPAFPSMPTQELRGGQTSGYSNAPNAPNAPLSPGQFQRGLNNRSPVSQPQYPPQPQYPSHEQTVPITADQLSTSKLDVEESNDYSVRQATPEESSWQKKNSVRVRLDGKVSHQRSPHTNHHRWRRHVNRNDASNHAMPTQSVSNHHHHNHKEASKQYQQREATAQTTNIPAHFMSPPPSYSFPSPNMNSFSSPSSPMPHNPSSSSIIPTNTNHRLPRQSTWAEKKRYLQSISPFGHLPGYKIRSFMIKTGDDIRKEQLGIQLLAYMQKMFQEAGLDIYLRPYQIMAVGKSSGLMEYLEGTRSIDTIKKLVKQYSIPSQQPQQQKDSHNMHNYMQSGYSHQGHNHHPWQPLQSDGNGWNYPGQPMPPAGGSTLPGPNNNDNSNSNVPNDLKEYFRSQFGESYSVSYHSALQNFMKSLVGYSLFTYIVQVKDRHNGNILIDEEGHIIHIDFGFILGDSPGFNMNFESAPFKLPREYIDLLGGIQSPLYAMFEEMFVKGFVLLQQHAEQLASIVQLFYGDKRKGAADALRSRLTFPRSHADIYTLIDESIDNWRTRQYDWFQQQSNNILM